MEDVRDHMEALTDPDTSVRSRAAEALGKIGDLTAITALIEAVNDSEYDVWREACIALSLFGESVIFALVEALKDTELLASLEAVTVGSCHCSAEHLSSPKGWRRF